MYILFFCILGLCVPSIFMTGKYMVRYEGLEKNARREPLRYVIFRR